MGAKHQDLLKFDKAQYESHVVRFLIDNLRTTPQFDAYRFSKTEVEQLIGDSLKAKKPLVFGPNQGVFHCCDLGEPYLEFRPEHTLLDMETATSDGRFPLATTSPRTARLS